MACRLREMKGRVGRSCVRSDPPGSAVVGPGAYTYGAASTEYICLVHFPLREPTQSFAFFERLMGDEAQEPPVGTFSGFPPGVLTQIEAFESRWKWRFAHKAIEMAFGHLGRRISRIREAQKLIELIASRILKELCTLDSASSFATGTSQLSTRPVDPHGYYAYFTTRCRKFPSGELYMRPAGVPNCLRHSIDRKGNGDDHEAWVPQKLHPISNDPGTRT